MPSSSGSNTGFSPFFCCRSYARKAFMAFSESSSIAMMFIQAIVPTPISPRHQIVLASLSEPKKTEATTANRNAQSAIFSRRPFPNR